MKIITEGYNYELANVGEGAQTLQFIQKEPTGVGDELKTVTDGTTNEEVLAMLIDRLNFLQQKLPAVENARVIRMLQESLTLLQRRTDDRLRRKVEGTSAK